MLTYKQLRCIRVPKCQVRVRVLQSQVRVQVRVTKTQVRVQVRVPKFQVRVRVTYIKLVITKMSQNAIVCVVATVINITTLQISVKAKIKLNFKGTTIRMASGYHSMNLNPHKGVWPDLLPLQRVKQE